MYGNVEALLLKAATSQPYEEQLKHVISFYSSDFDYTLLSTHLEIFSKTFQPISSEKQTMVSDILTFFQSSSPGQVQLMHQVAKLMTLLLVMPATNAQSEWSFNSVGRIKTYLRSSMSQKRLNHLMLLHIHKTGTDERDLIHVANNFISNHKHRKNFFGIEFKQSHLNQ
uniref:HAT C-terminal dimerisation domain-containing protein n=1 Tax=Amphimedon queenslandica TaxID=400682 RepID=A0A1X7VWM0_AMPQE